MSEREDFELDKEALTRIDLSLGRYDSDDGGRTARRRGPFLVVLLLALAGAALYFVLDRRGRVEDAAQEPAAAAPTRPAPPAAAAPADTRPLPALASSDAFVRELVGGLSRHPQLAAWLASDELVRRFVAATASFAEGKSPGQHVPFLRPAAPFAASDGGGGPALDAEAYRRYELLAEAVDSLDVAGTAELYRRLEPLFDEAYRELGFPDGRFREVAEPAIDRLLAAPAIDGPVDLVAAPVGYRFAEVGWEEMDAASKHLLRLGPRNLARIQAKVTAIAAAAGLSPGP